MKRKSTPSSAQPWVRTAEPLLWLTGAGQENQTHPSYFYDARIRPDRPHWVLQLTLHGAGFFERRKRRTLLTPGTAFLHKIPGDFRYGFPPEKSEPYQLVYVSLRGHDAHWCQRIVDSHGHILRFPPANPVAPLMLAIARQHAASTRPGPIATPAHDRYLASAQLYQLLMTVISALNASRIALEPLISRALDLLSTHAANSAFDVASLANLLACSREHLARQFHAATGVNPSDYLLQQRLRLAAQHLRNSPDKLESIARASGFAGANYFCRAFKKRLGVTPTDFRNRPTLAMP